ncbi:MAG: hypothetical protein KHZ59_04915 [Streptococcus salivarius]|nr:hypothetical protein [Streptococcus salivarius]
MRKKLIGILLILLAALVIVQDYFIKWEISIWMLAWVVLLAILSLSSLLKRHFGLGFAYGIVALFSLNGQFHFLPVSNSVLIFSSIFAVIDIDVTFSTVTKYLNDQQFTHGSADVSLGQASVYFDNCRIEGPSAQFDVDVSLGSLSLYVPSDWRVHVNVDNSLSAVQHEENPSNLTNKDFYIKGDVSLGNLEIIYVGENAID